MTRRLVPYGLQDDPDNELSPVDRARLRELLGHAGSRRAAMVLRRPIEQIESAAYDDPPYRWSVRDPWEVRMALEDAIVRWEERASRRPIG